jgi:hypothetical protein
MNDLDQISSELADKIKVWVRSHPVTEQLLDARLITKDAELMYIEFREAYDLSFEECEQVDRLFAKKMVFDSRRIFKRKKERLKE